MLSYLIRIQFAFIHWVGVLDNFHHIVTKLH